MGIMKNINDIVERNINLVPFVLKRMGLIRKYDEYVDIGWIGLVYGAKNYDETKGKESTFLYKSIKTAIQWYLSFENRQKRSGVEILSLDYQYIDFDGNVWTLEETIGYDNVDSHFFIIDFIDKIKVVLKDMKNRGYKVRYDNVVCDYFGFGTIKLNNIEILQKYSISKRLLYDIIKLFRKKLKKELSLEE